MYGMLTNPSALITKKREKKVSAIPIIYMYATLVEEWVGRTTEKNLHNHNSERIGTQ